MGNGCDGGLEREERFHPAKCAGSCSGLSSQAEEGGREISLCAGRRIRRSECGGKSRPAPFEMTVWGARRIEERPDVWSGLPVFWGKWGRLPCGGGGGLGFDSELGDDAELLHEAESVPVDIAFRQLAVQEASDGDAGDGELLSGGGHPVEIPFVGAVTGPTGHDGFAFGNDVLDRQMKVGESSAVEGRSLPFTLGAVPKIG